MRSLFRNPLGLTGFCITFFVVSAMIVGPWISPYSPTEADYMALLAPPGWSHDGSRLTSTDIKREAGLLPHDHTTKPMPRA